MIVIKRVSLTCNDEEIWFKYDYVTRKRRDVLEKAIERAIHHGNEWMIQCAIVETKTVAGYGNQHSPPSKVLWEEVSREEISLEDLRARFQ